MKNLIRADKYLTERGFAESRTRAADLIRQGNVKINSKLVSKPATMVPRGSPIIIEDKGPEYVSRGAHKLLQAVEQFQINCQDKVALDCGASTGGFSDVLLRNGARKIYAVDVGYGQLHWSLRNDDRVVVMERTNLRTMSDELISEPLDIVTLDMSFISLKLILEKILRLLSEMGDVIALIKPQFEAGRDRVGSGGVVRSKSVHKDVLTDMAKWCLDHGYVLKDVARSPITGPKGNVEFLFHLIPGSDSFSSEHESKINKVITK